MSLLKKSANSTYLLVILFLITVVNYLDRQVLSIVQEDVKLDLGLSDSQLGLLVLAFGAMHALFAIPIGRLADKKSRKHILVICLTIWSGFTALGGAVSNFFQLLVTRMGVGMGEAGVTPTSYSLVSDKFPIKKTGYCLSCTRRGYIDWCHALSDIGGQAGRYDWVALDLCCFWSARLDFGYFVCIYH